MKNKREEAGVNGFLNEMMLIGLGIAAALCLSACAPTMMPGNPSSINIGADSNASNGTEGIKGTITPSGPNCNLTGASTGLTAHAYLCPQGAAQCALTKSVPVDSNLNFEIDVGPGTYTVTADPINGVTPTPKTGVIVTSGQFVSITLQLTCN